MTNPHESAARLTKATAIAVVLEAVHPNLDTSLPCSEFFRHASTETQDVVAAMAEVRLPSDAAWALAIQIVERRERVASKLAGAR